MANADQRGAILFSWTFPEYRRYERGRMWYTGAAVIAVALLAYAFATRNFLFVVILVMVAVVLYLRSTREPDRLTCEVREDGIVFEDRFLAYTDLQNFCIVDDAGPRGTLYLQSGGFRPRVAIPIEDSDAATVREAIRKFLPESEDREEPTADVIARVLKL